MIKILLDQGHGQGSRFNRGYLSGTKWKNEGDGNYYFGEILEKAINQYDGVQVFKTRKNISQDPSYKSRGNQANGMDLFISLHTNAFNPGVSGVEAYLDVGKGNAPTELAENICKTISETLEIPNRKTHKKYHNGGNYYAVLRHNLAKKGMLLETCFHTNRKDVTNYEARAEILAENIAKEIAKHYNLKAKNGANTNENNQIGEMTMLGNKPVAIISLTQEAINKQAKDMESARMLFKWLYDDYNPVIMISGLNDFANIKSNYIIGLGGTKGNHSGYINYFIGGATQEETYQNALKFVRNGDEGRKEFKL